MAELKEHQIFRMRASPFFWKEKAYGLRFAANVLWPEAEKQLEAVFMHTKKKRAEPLDESVRLHTFDVCLGLVGHAAECLFKGIIIRDDPTLISNGKLAGRFTKHGLLKLAKDAKVQLSATERSFCENAQYCMDTSFRYPIGKDLKHERTSITSGGHPRIVFDKLFERLSKELDFVVAARGALVPFTR